LGWVFAVQALLLAVAGWRNWLQLNPDAVAYCRIAGYYANGQLDWAVTGYWGPLLSWLMVPWLKLGCGPLVAARVVMAGSAVVFLVGAGAVFRAFRLPRVALLTGAWVAAGWSVFWSVRNISPDLLMAGLVGLAVSATVKCFLARSARGVKAESKCGMRNAECGIAARGQLTAAATAGLWWGAAYLAKAVALPLALLTTVGLALFALSGRGELRRELALRLGAVWLGLALVAGPWIGVLSGHYGKFTFSTTGPIAHALAGPGEAARYHPAMVTLHTPDLGRLTQWEEPSWMAYRRWSPFASGENFRHQLAVVGRNVDTLTDWLWGVRWMSGAADARGAARMLPGFDLLGLSLAAVLGGVAVTVVNRRRLRRVRWSWAAVPVVALGGLYLPFWVQPEDQRYFYGVLPLVWVLVVGGWGWACRQGWGWTASIRRRVFRVAVVAFSVPALLWLAVGLVGLPNAASRAAWELMTALRANGHCGPLAGSGQLPGGRTGLYAAFLLGERWLGDDPSAGPAEFAAAGARVVVLRRGSPQEQAFAGDARWRAVAVETAAPVQVFQRDNP
jgi:hypothetical protein